MSEPTPGPWEVRAFNASVGVCNPRIKDNYQSIIAECPQWLGGGHHNQQPDRDTAKANARLIAAAPDLLEALERATNTLELAFGEDPEAETVIGEACAAIRKAKGEQDG